MRRVADCHLYGHAINRSNQFFFNVLNHPNFDLQVNNLALGNFGTITSTVSSPTSAYGSFQGSAVSGRVIQTQIKFTF